MVRAALQLHIMYPLFLALMTKFLARDQEAIRKKMNRRHCAFEAGMWWGWTQSPDSRPWFSGVECENVTCKVS